MNIYHQRTHFIFCLRLVYIVFPKEEYIFKLERLGWGFFSLYGSTLLFNFVNAGIIVGLVVSRVVEVNVYLDKVLRYIVNTSWASQLDKGFIALAWAGYSLKKLGFCKKWKMSLGKSILSYINIIECFLSMFLTVD